MEQLRREHPEYMILLTFFSPSGYEVRKNYEGADIICYLPLDTITNARRFLRTVRPVMAFFIKYEFWYNYLHILKHRNVPVYSVSSIFRPGQIFFRWYGRQYSCVLKCFTWFFVQNETSRELLHSIGIDNVTITGDTRFDRVLEIKDQAKQLPVVSNFCEYNISDSPDDDIITAYAGSTPPEGVFVAGSSWPPDEDIFIRYFLERKLLGRGKWKLIIAPHVIDESHLQQIEQKLEGCNVVRYTKATTDISIQRADVLIIDCFGLLSSIYRYGTVSYVGGGFGVGIHNVLEAAVWDMPVIFGPNNKNFQEALGLLEAKGGYEILDEDDFSHLMDKLSEDHQLLKEVSQNAGAFVNSQIGATDKVMASVGL
jgi:3-deoxy-D-manno-octulosonic-acid transferase